MTIREQMYECCILGAGPAGLGAAVELAHHGVTNIVVVDRHPIVGGLARTETFEGARFDVGPHRFFTKSRLINTLWHVMLGEDFRPVSRMTRICYKRRYFQYPLKAFDALIKLGPVESAQALLSFAATKLSRPSSEPKTFEDWIVQKFGRKLYETFFKTYTEKVWGIPCNQIGAEWAAQRIRGLDIIQLLKHSLLAGGKKRQRIRTLVEQFDYPRLGAGQMYEAMAERVAGHGARLLLGARVTAFHQQGNAITAVDVVTATGEEVRIRAAHVFNSIPLTRFFHLLSPAEPEPIRQAAGALYFREHVTVDLLVDGDDLFPDQWIYVHSPDVQIARLANYNNFSKAMVGRPGKSALSVEYFTFQHEPLWQKSDEELQALAVDEMAYLKLLDPRRVERAWVVRETESYPTYYLGFREPYQVLQRRLNQFVNLFPIGRGGLYKYNNQDHSTLSGILAARNYLKLPGSPYDLWSINTETDYHEEGQRPASS